MDNSLPVIGILAVYLLFVLKIGPQMMQTRKQVPLQAVLLIYNLAIAIFNAYMFATVTLKILTIKLGRFVSIRLQRSAMNGTSTRWNELARFKEIEIKNNYVRRVHEIETCWLDQEFNIVTIFSK